jgi:hypothetical protein
MADRVLLNIGGERFETSRATLTRVPGTLFHALFSKDPVEIEAGDDGSIFFDRDPSHFEHILAFLRDGTLAVAGQPEQPSVGLLLYLQREFSYYLIRVAVSLPSEALDSAVVILLANYDWEGAVVDAAWPLATSRTRVLHVKPPARTAVAYCVVGREALYMSGGIERGIPSGLSRHVNKFDIRSKLWTAETLMPEPLFWHSAVAVCHDLYFIGGMTSTGECSREVSVWDTQTRTWSRAPPLPVGRFAAAACSFGQSIYVFGGRNDGGRRVESFIQLPQVFIFDTVVNTWRKGGEMPLLRGHVDPLRCSRQSATLVGGLIYLTGGPHRCVLRYNPTAPADNSAWSLCPPSPWQHALAHSQLMPFLQYGVAFAFNGRLILQSTGGVEEYNPDSESWSMLPSFSAGRQQSYVGAAAVGEPSTPEEEEAELFSSLISRARRRDRVARLADIDLTVDSDRDYNPQDSDEGES